MPDKPDEEIRKSIKRFEESLPESERNPDAQLRISCNVAVYLAIYRPNENYMPKMLGWIIEKG